MVTETIPRMHTRRWKIVCKMGSFMTYSMKKSDADEVARWCDQNHRDCRPHTVIVKIKGSGRTPNV